jgi:hypothetical protein
MTNQSDDKVRVQTPLKRTPGDYIRRADGSWNVLSLALGPYLSPPWVTCCRMN